MVISQPLTISSNGKTDQYSVEHSAGNMFITLGYFSVHFSPLWCCPMNSSLPVLSGAQLPLPPARFCMCSSSLNCGLETLQWHQPRTFTRLTLFIFCVSGISLFGCLMLSTLIWYFCFHCCFMQDSKSNPCYSISPEVSADFNNGDKWQEDYEPLCVFSKKI